MARAAAPPTSSVMAQAEQVSLLAALGPGGGTGEGDASVWTDCGLCGPLALVCDRGAGVVAFKLQLFAARGAQGAFAVPGSWLAEGFLKLWSSWINCLAALMPREYTSPGRLA